MPCSLVMRHAVHCEDMGARHALALLCQAPAPVAGNPCVPPDRAVIEARDSSRLATLPGIARLARCVVAQAPARHAIYSVAPRPFDPSLLSERRHGNLSSPIASIVSAKGHHLCVLATSSLVVAASLNLSLLSSTVCKATPPICGHGRLAGR
ncbi:uncharacterized protein B0I36DRAFT_325137 [Microdochium trichocladiopsis]|uniref:Uncharacterized protein n=1 Tax=Microdochium trichocladiopsis TaxID=1682393 RepID=A0A9P8Y6P5_9PEZI|nr:uncharacterized protein B0I36DRAFT_325137 [Microdochium trichocladiopsis]KAH7029151.1 hypothetical protein B0I36DRAFT_325137 [Microdochium trichocladiopsis]